MTDDKNTTQQGLRESVTIALPAFNEEASLEGVAAASLAALEASGAPEFEVLIVNDGSADATGRVARGLAADDPRVRLVEHGRNLGFAAAQRACYRNAAMDWIFLIPSDGQIDPAALRDFVPLCANNDLILGVTAGAPERGPRQALSGGYHALVNALFGLKLGAFGPCLMARRALVNELPLNCNTPVAMTELVVRARARGARIAEVAVEKGPRAHGAARGGRLLHLTPQILFELFRLRLEYNNLG